MYALLYGEEEGEGLNTGYVCTALWGGGGEGLNTGYVCGEEEGEGLNTGYVCTDDGTMHSSYSCHGYPLFAPSTSYIIQWLTLYLTINIHYVQL